ncbi:uncharacterized protein BCR38DRAFT_355607 [Pseudomassariella vexata]|uniref:Tautomerase cis-CaaD-like domain-containing protein n=1 Tax=Pseudomassariella vexata TaxID=1141098 RepID=A0A1Y2DBG3_9PEZI|nr:uncharacterized protein BCR38DRAFT_355607 [Pseudomassariella vexata]ORY56613.1 hypothetical protein BCR38DRAFT_355607 [Pseudomassariella vexata]
MPVWQVLHPNTVLTDATKKASLDKDITALYTNGGLPAFYVSVYFHSLSGSDI